MSIDSRVPSVRELDIISPLMKADKNPFIPGRYATTTHPASMLEWGGNTEKVIRDNVPAIRGSLLSAGVVACSR